MYLEATDCSFLWCPHFTQQSHSPRAPVNATLSIFFVFLSRLAPIITGPQRHSLSSTLRRAAPVLPEQARVAAEGEIRPRQEGYI